MRWVAVILFVGTIVLSVLDNHFVSGCLGEGTTPRPERRPVSQTIQLPESERVEVSYKATDCQDVGHITTVKALMTNRAHEDDTFGSASQRCSTNSWSKINITREYVTMPDGNRVRIRGNHAAIEGRSLTITTKYPITFRVNYEKPTTLAPTTLAPTTLAPEDHSISLPITLSSVFGSLAMVGVVGGIAGFFFLKKIRSNRDKAQENSNNAENGIEEDLDHETEDVLYEDITSEQIYDDINEYKIYDDWDADLYRASCNELQNHPKDRQAIINQTVIAKGGVKLFP